MCRKMSPILLTIGVIILSLCSANDAVKTDTDEANLQYLKIGLCFALFFVVLISCGLPILILDILTKRNDLNNSSSSECPQDVSGRTNSTSNLLQSDSKFKLWSSRISCFAAGVFLTTGFMDLFPDVQETVEEALKTLGKDLDYPLGSLFALIGFFLILSIERMLASHNMHESPEMHSFFKTISLLVALSLHSVFEGLAVGLEHTYTKTMTIFFALLIHKVIIALSMGINLSTLRAASETGSTVSTKTMMMQLASTLVFAFASPVGLFIGWALLASQSASSGTMLMTTAVLQGFACGTFFFVVFCEILPDEFNSKAKDQIMKLLFLIAGFVLIATFMVFLPH